MYDEFILLVDIEENYENDGWLLFVQWQIKCISRIKTRSYRKSYEYKPGFALDRHVGSDF